MRIKSKMLGSAQQAFNSSNVYLTFSVIFILCWLPILLCMITQDKSLIKADADAAIQHYPVIVYYGQWLRDYLHNIFVNHNFILPVWDMSLGYGNDIIACLNYYGVGDPITLISVFFTPEKAEYCYDIIIIARLYFAGLASVYLFRYKNMSKLGAIVGAVVYCFSGYAMHPAIFHPFFAIPMIWFPLMIAGTEKLYSEKKGGLFIASVALFGISNFYFLYMAIIFIVLFVIIRFFHYRKFNVKELISCLWQFSWRGVLALCLSMPILLPNILGVLGSQRVGAERKIDLLYPMSYYRNMAMAWVDKYEGYYLYIGVSGVAIALTALFLSTSARKNKQIKMILAGLILFTMIPAVGSFLNGMSYPTNRFVWALILVVAYCSAHVVTNLKEITKKQVYIASGICLVFSLLCVMCGQSYKIIILTYAALFIIWLTLLILGVWSRKSSDNGILLPKALISLLLVGSICLSNFFVFSRYGQNIFYYYSYADSGKAYERFLDTKLIKAISGLDDIKTVRYEYFGSSKNCKYNNAMSFGFNSLGYYFSTIDPTVEKFQRSLWNNNYMGQAYMGVDARTFVDAALGVKYFVTGQKTAAVPFSYEKVADNNGMIVYACNEVTGPVYVYDSAYFDDGELTPLQRQELLLQCALVKDGTDLNGLEKAEPSYEHKYVDFSVKKGSEDIDILNGFTVKQAGETLDLYFDPVIGEDLYILLQVGDCVTSEGSPEIVFNDMEHINTFVTDPPTSSHYCGYENFIVNLGYSKNARDHISLTFTNPGDYLIKSLKIASQPMSRVKEQIKKLYSGGVSDLSIENSRISFNLSREKSGIVCVAIPFNSWRVKVDGQAVKLLKVNNGLCGFTVEPGEHSVEMTFVPKAEFAGMTAALCAAAILSSVTIRKRKKSFPAGTNK